ncbi:hypothetical protein DMI70_02675 [Escherichia coli]|nr:hypothetical protein [Escherichia coli]
MSSAKKIGYFACTGVVAGNKDGSGIALLPANQQVSVVLPSGVDYSHYWCNVAGICICPTGNKTRNKVANCVCRRNFPHLVFRQVFFITMLTDW